MFVPLCFVGCPYGRCIATQLMLTLALACEGEGEVPAHSDLVSVVHMSDSFVQLQRAHDVRLGALL